MCVILCQICQQVNKLEKPAMKSRHAFLKSPVSLTISRDLSFFQIFFFVCFFMCQICQQVNKLEFGKKPDMFLWSTLSCQLFNRVAHPNFCKVQYVFFHVSNLSTSQQTWCWEKSRHVFWSAWSVNYLNRVTHPNF